VPILRLQGGGISPTLTQGGTGIVTECATYEPLFMLIHSQVGSQWLAWCTLLCTLCTLVQPNQLAFFSPNTAALAPFMRSRPCAPPPCRCPLQVDLLMELFITMKGAYVEPGAHRNASPSNAPSPA
jgi:hypothetical protein